MAADDDPEFPPGLEDHRRSMHGRPGLLLVLVVVVIVVVAVVVLGGEAGATAANR